MHGISHWRIWARTINTSKGRPVWIGAWKVSDQCQIRSHITFTWVQHRLSSIWPSFFHSSLHRISIFSHLKHLLIPSFSWEVWALCIMRHSVLIENQPGVQDRTVHKEIHIYLLPLLSTTPVPTIIRDFLLRFPQTPYPKFFLNFQVFAQSATPIRV